jgi:hypothetical protein
MLTLILGLVLVSNMNAEQQSWRNKLFLNNKQFQPFQPFGSSDTSIENSQVVAIESNQFNNFNNNNNQQSLPSTVGSMSPIVETLLSGITFDCSQKPTGPNKDSLYCDVFHACVYGRQQKTYGCPQVGDRFFYDASTQK